MDDQHHYEYVKSEVEERFICSVCLEVMVDSVETDCGHCFCLYCLLQALRSTEDCCPNCRTRITEHGFHPLISLSREIANLNVHCPQKNSGCAEVGNVKYMDRHVREGCPWQLISCPRGCSSRVLRKNIPFHLSKVCRNRLQRCPLCDRDLQAKVFENHINRCEGNVNGYGATDVRKSLNSIVDDHTQDFDDENDGSSHVVSDTSQRASCQGFCYRRRLIVFSGSVALFLGLALLIGVTQIFDKQTPATPSTSPFNQSCTVGSDMCVDPRGKTLMQCDRLKSVCLLQVGQPCPANHSEDCVTGAACSPANGLCTCEEGEFIAENHICVLKRGEDCRAGYGVLCGSGQKCDVAGSGQCQCTKNFLPSGPVCQLKAEIPGENCASVSHCVNHSTCDDGSGQCLCDRPFFSLRSDHTCGLNAKVPSMNCNQVGPCVDHAQCSHSSGQCLCDNNFSIRKNGLCGLKADMYGIDCKTEKPCIDNAACDSYSGKCQCDRFFHVRFDHLCGLEVLDTDVVDCTSVDYCIDHASCNGDTRRCQCENGYSPQDDGLCYSDKGGHQRPSRLYVLSAVVTYIIVTPALLQGHPINIPLC